MGKQGPCHHCGATSTPLWRNGPPEKPILCNACGSRWRTKGTLVNYTPIHAREGVDQIGVGRGKGVDQEVKRKRKEFLSLKGRRENEGEAAPAEEDTSNRSSSGSAISYSESCSHFGGEPAAAQSNAWDSLVPSRKRSCVGRPKPSHVEQLTMDLHSILHQQPSYISTSPEEDLLYDSDIHYGSFEIGNGGVVLRHSNPAAPDEESEASSLPAAMDSYSRISSLPVNSIGKIKTSLPLAEDNLLKSKNSPLTAVNLEKIFNPEIFLQRLTLEEQQQLKRYLPRVDATSESLLDLFRSKQFKENISSFGQLLQEGIFDLSSSAANSDECRALEKLVLGSSEKSKWVECYVQIKGSTGADRRRKGVRIGGERPEKKLDMKSPKRTNKPRVGSILSLESPSSLSYGLLEEEEEGLLLDLRPSGSFPEAELLSETWKLTSTSSSSSYPLKRLGS